LYFSKATTSPFLYTFAKSKAGFQQDLLCYWLTATQTGNGALAAEPGGLCSSFRSDCVKAFPPTHTKTPPVTFGSILPYWATVAI